MARRRVTPEAQARADRIAAALSGLLDDLPPPAPTRAANPGDPYRHTEAMPPRPTRRAELSCPACGRDMGVEVRRCVEIHRCTACDGLWLDPGEVDVLVDPPVNASVDVGNLRSQMQAVTSVQRDVRYRKCPRCHGVMNRRNFAAHSGVIIDECPTHGLFLDPGEFEAIETFVRLGGLALQRQSMQRRLREQTRRAEAAKAEASHSMWTVRRRYWWDVFFGI